MSLKVLIVDENESRSAALASTLSSTYDISVVGDGESALSVIKKGEIAIVLTEASLPGMDSIGLIEKLSQLNPKTVVIVTAGDPTVERAVAATKAGAFNYVKTPAAKEVIELTVRRAAQLYEQLASKGSGPASFQNIVGESASIKDIFTLIERVADSDSSILVLGESGTGKELIAKTIHYNSNRVDEPFVPVNCGAIPSELLESELFGHEKGAFTGAVSSRPGRFERAHGGTIFLDEIGELAFPLQVKLLRVLQEREFERVGGNKTIQVDVRIVAATNRDLEECVRNRTFREDLYYRLNVIPVHVPALRERRDDIPLLANYFLKKLCARKVREITGISDKAMKLFVDYPWPGNIRELENIIERIVILKPDEGHVSIEDVPEKISGHSGADSIYPLDIPHEGVSLPKLIDEMERDFIQKALEKADGVKARAADLLGINRTTLLEKMKKKGLMDR